MVSLGSVNDVACVMYRLAKIDKEKVRGALGLRDQLKSTGQSKFTLDEKEEVCTCVHYCL